MIRKNELNPLDILLEDSNFDKDEIKIEVYLSKIDYRNLIRAELKIGYKKERSNKLNVIKDIKQFLIYYENKVPLKFSNDFTFDINGQKFSDKDLSLINYIYDLLDIDKENSKNIRKYDKAIDGKYIYPPKYMLKEFFRTIKNHRVFLNEEFYSRPVDCEIALENPFIQSNIELYKDNYKITLNTELPSVLNNKFDIMLYGTTIYLPNKEFINKIKPYYKVFNKSKDIFISVDNEERILRELLPILNELGSVNISDSIKNKVIMSKPKFKFYFDKEDDIYFLILKVKYEELEFNIFDECNEKIIHRALHKEEEIISMLKSLGFDNINNKFYLNLGNDYIYNFFKNKINILQEIGEVYYSENFKGIKNLETKDIKVHIAPGKYNYFEFDFNIEDINYNEVNYILEAFKKKLKYYKLENGEFLDLENLELKNLLRLIDVLNSDNNIKDSKIEFNKNKGLYINEYINEYKLRFIKGKGYLRELKSKFNGIDKFKYNIPLELNATLRKYQYKGYCWLKTLDEMGFGGILADEMGLGKTLQMITFLLSNKNTNSLIITPVSLVYNWKREIERFAPTLKVGVATNNKEYREKIINNYNEYDIVITTYSLLKNDIDEYKKINFDYIVLDEAQYIKNSSSQNAKYIKALKSKNRFALTGTPLENSLLELWSIFDFIMPGYLYDENTFIVKYYRRLMEEEILLEEVQKLIKPFILRRLKKDVAKELPNKIEKIIEVELPYEQQKIYGIYSKKILELVEDKIKDDEFTNGKIEILSYITKLRQIACDPRVVLDEYNGKVGKIDTLIEILNQAIEEGHKILVFSQFTSILRNIKYKLDLEKISNSYLDGSTPVKKRKEVVDEFNNRDNSVFLISLKAGGTGLNLQSADIVIHFDPWWNPAVENQATDRSHRIGQKNVVEVIKLVAKGTLEEKIINLQNEKKKLINSILEKDFDDHQNILTLTEEEILNLFR